MFRLLGVNFRHLACEVEFVAASSTDYGIPFSRDQADLGKNLLYLQ